MHIKLTNGTPEIYSIGQLRRDNPQTSFPKHPSDELLAKWNVYPYVQQDQPAYDRLTEKLSEGPIEQIDGVWTKTWTVEQLPFEDARSNMHDHLADIRWRKETGGVALPTGQTIQTTREAQAQVSSTYSSLKDSLVTTADWKTENGWVSVTLTEFQPIAQVVAAHVQACFAAERQVSEQIEAAQTVSDLTVIDLEAEFQTAYNALTKQ